MYQPHITNYKAELGRGKQKITMMDYYRITAKDEHSIDVEHPKGTIVEVTGEYREGIFYPHPESLAKHGIDEDAMFKHLKENPQCSNTLLTKDE